MDTITEKLDDIATLLSETLAGFDDKRSSGLRTRADLESLTRQVEELRESLKRFYQLPVEIVQLQERMANLKEIVGQLQSAQQALSRTNDQGVPAPAPESSRAPAAVLVALITVIAGIITGAFSRLLEMTIKFLKAQ